MQSIIHILKSSSFLSLHRPLRSYSPLLLGWLIVLFIGTGTAVWAQTGPGAVIEEGFYEIRPLSDTTKALDVGVRNDGTDGDNVKQWESSGNPNQQWEIIEVDEGYYRVSPIYDTSFALDAAGTTRSSTVRVWTYDGQPNQQWRFYEDNGFYEIAPRSVVEGEGVPALRLDVVGGRTDNNANIQIYTDNNSTAQRWYLKSVTARTDGGGGGDDNGGDNPVLATDDEEPASLSLSVYPNPAQSEVIWKRPTGEPATLSVIALRGQLVKSQLVIGTQGTLPIEELAQGLYMVTVQTPTQQYQQRLLVE